MGDAVCLGQTLTKQPHVWGRKVTYSHVYLMSLVIQFINYQLGIMHDARYWCLEMNSEDVVSAIIETWKNTVV